MQCVSYVAFNGIHALLAGVDGNGLTALAGSAVPDLLAVRRARVADPTTKEGVR